MNVLGRVAIAAVVVGGIVALGLVMARRSTTVGSQVTTAIDQLTTRPDTATDLAYSSPPNGWWARIENSHTTIHCAVAVGPDTTIRGAPSGTPICYQGQ